MITKITTNNFEYGSTSYANYVPQKQIYHKKILDYYVPFQKVRLYVINWLGVENRTPLKIMSEEHKMTKQDKLILGITLATIFGGVFLLGLIGLIVNLLSWKKMDLGCRVTERPFLLYNRMFNHTSGLYTIKLAKDFHAFGCIEI